MPGLCLARRRADRRAPAESALAVRAHAGRHGGSRRASSRGELRVALRDRALLGREKAPVRAGRRRSSRSRLSPQRSFSWSLRSRSHSPHRDPSAISCSSASLGPEPRAHTSPIRASGSVSFRFWAIAWSPPPGSPSGRFSGTSAWRSRKRCSSRSRWPQPGASRSGFCWLARKRSLPLAHLGGGNPLDHVLCVAIAMPPYLLWNLPFLLIAITRMDRAVMRWSSIGLLFSVVRSGLRREALPRRSSDPHHGSQRGKGCRRGPVRPHPGERLPLPCRRRPS